MKPNATKVIAVSLSAVLAAGGLGGLLYGRAAGGEGVRPAVTVPLAVTAGTTGVPVKDETVYILAGADGAVEKIIVSDWLKNPSGSAKLQDRTTLRDVENVKGEETFTANGGALVWDAQGGDIYYQGATDQELPVDVAVTYLLDGRAVTPEELAGRSGRVTIRFDYTNRQYQMMDVGGEQEKIYVPFVMLTGMVLDNDVFTNVEVSSGKVYSDGNRTAVMGLAFPGLRESLNLDAEKLDIPNYVEVTADVENFELATTVTLAVSDVFADVKVGEGDSLEDLQSSLDDLTGAMDQLMDGSSALCEGLNTLLEKSGTLVEGIDQLAAGAEALKSGAGELEAGTQRLQEGAKTLDAGLQALSEKSGTLNAGAEQVFEGLLASAQAQLTAAGAQVPDLTPENYGKVLDGVIAAMPQGGEKVEALKASLDSYSAFCQGLEAYTAGVDQAAAGARSVAGGAENLQSGAGKLTAGATELSGGAASLKEAGPALTAGVTELRDGAKELSEGLVEFNEEGIEKLVDAVDGDLAGLMDRLRAVSDAAKGYNSFAGIDSEGEGQVKFVYRTEAIQVPEE